VQANDETTNPFSLDGRTAVITGGSRGIGYAIAEGFVRAGARVIIAARSRDQLDDAVKTLGANAIAKQTDISDPDSIDELIAEAWRIGPPDIIVNNAGISPFYKRAELFTVEEWDQIVDINQRGSFFMSLAAAKRWFEDGRAGNIINISSVTGVHASERTIIYSMTKAALDQMTRVMALEWADRNVRVNSIAPGWTESDFTHELFESRHGEKLLASIPQNRFAEPEDIVGAALYLASDASSYVTGSVLVVDGGRALY
jgi:NAD(P)-dependent dehydrogenase (short-subunit alcohol dehydrogenase family)